MTASCEPVRERLPELLTRPDPTDPEEEILAPLRQHLRTCAECQAELDDLRAFFALGREAMEYLLDEKELAHLESGLQADREAFLAMVQADLQRATAGLSPVPDETGTSLSRALTRLRSLSPSGRLEILKQSVTAVLQSIMPDELPLLDFMWQTRLSGQNSAARARPWWKRWRTAPALGAVGGDEAGSMETPALIELALWLDTHAASIGATGSEEIPPALTISLDTQELLLQEVLASIPLPNETG